MVKFATNKLIIELDTHCPLDDLNNLQTEIIEAIRHYDLSNYEAPKGCPYSGLLDLLAATLPSYREMRFIHEAREIASQCKSDPSKIKYALRWLSEPSNSPNA